MCICVCVIADANTDMYLSKSVQLFLFLFLLIRIRKRIPIMDFITTNAIMDITVTLQITSYVKKHIHTKQQAHTYSKLHITVFSISVATTAITLHFEKER